MLKFMLLLIAAVTVLPGSLTAQLGDPGILTVRLYNSFGVSLRHLKEARRTAGEIFERARLGHAWRECRTPEGPSAESRDTCADTLGRSEVIVRIVASPTPRKSTDLALGYSHVDAGAGAGTLSTVFADRVSLMSRQVGVDAAVLLGRVVAHELGHLLMGTMTHSPDGLMREQWASDSLFDVEEDWLFSEGEVAFLRGGLLARQHGLPVPVFNLAERTQQTTP